MEEKRRSLVEALAVIDIDPALSLFTSECTYVPKVARIEMAHWNRNHKRQLSRQLSSFQEHPPRARGLPHPHLLREQ